MTLEHRERDPQLPVIRLGEEFTPWKNITPEEEVDIMFAGRSERYFQLLLPTTLGERPLTMTSTLLSLQSQHVSDLGIHPFDRKRTYQFTPADKEESTRIQKIAQYLKQSTKLYPTNLADMSFRFNSKDVFNSGIFQRSPDNSGTFLVHPTDRILLENLQAIVEAQGQIFLSNTCSSSPTEWDGFFSLSGFYPEEIGPLPGIDTWATYYSYEQNDTFDRSKLELSAGHQLVFSFEELKRLNEVSTRFVIHPKIAKEYPF